MTRLPSSRRPSPLSFSCEFFPPSGPKGRKKLVETVKQLAPLKPELFTVTYGAGGSTQDRTKETVELLLATSDVAVGGHITGVGATKNDVDAVVRSYIEAGVRHVVAIRGDGAEAGTSGYETAADLVGGLRSHPWTEGLEILVAGYPEVHPKAVSAQADIESLKRKVDAGADKIVTQLFLDNEDFLRFRDAVEKAGIDVPLVPGIMPLDDPKWRFSFAEKCGSRVPESVVNLFAAVEDSPETSGMIAASLAAQQCQELVDAGVDEFHFYTMNKAELTVAVTTMLGFPGCTGAETVTESGS